MNLYLKQSSTIIIKRQAGKIEFELLDNLEEVLAQLNDFLLPVWFHHSVQPIDQARLDRIQH